MNELSYRTATIEDVDALQQLGILSYSQFKNSLSPDNWRIFNGNLSDKQKFIDVLKIAKCFVCIDGGKIIGVAYIIPSGNPNDIFLPEWSYIRMVGVNPDYRGQGIAKTLTTMCIDFARQNNEKTIALHTSEFMDAARHIYESMGFIPQKEFSLFGKRYWLYTLELN